MIRRLLPLLPLVALSGCLSFERVLYQIDLSAGKAVFIWQDLRGTGYGDFNDLLEDYVQGEAASKEFPRAVVEKKFMVPDGDSLDFELHLSFTSPEQLGILSWDAEHPYRFCPPDGLTVRAANADFRDPDGCVVWKAGATSLHIEAMRIDGVADETLLDEYKRWSLFRSKEGLKK